MFDVHKGEDQYVSLNTLMQVPEKMEKMQYSERTVLKEIKVPLLLVSYDATTSTLLAYDEQGGIHKFD